MAIFRVEHQAADYLVRTESELGQPSPGARLHSSEPISEQHPARPGKKITRPSRSAVEGDSMSRAASAQRVRVDRPLESRKPAREKSGQNNGQRHVHDQSWRSDDEQARAADYKYQVPALEAQLRQHKSLPCQRSIVAY